MNATPRRVSVARRRYLAALVDAGDESGDEAGSSDDEDEYAHSTASDSSDESMSPEKLCTLDVVRRVAVFLSFNKGSHVGVQPDESPASVAPATPLLGGHEQGGSPVASASPARIQRSPEELASALGALHLGSPGKRMCGKQGETSVEAFMVSSPGKRRAFGAEAVPQVLSGGQLRVQPLRAWPACP